MIVERIEEMRLTAQDETQISSLLAKAFGLEFDGRSYAQQRHHLRLVVRSDGQIIGHMAVTFRAIRMGDEIVHVAGLAEVASDPMHRGKGIATTLLKAAIAEVKQSIATFFILFGDLPLYAATGFMPKANVIRFASLEGVKTGEVMQAPNDGLMVMSLTEAKWDEHALIDLVGPTF